MVLERLWSRVCPILAARVLLHLATQYEERSEYAPAEKHYQQAVRILGNVGGRVAVEQHRAQVLGQLAGLYRLQGRYAEAEPLFHQALASAALGCIEYLKT